MPDIPLARRQVIASVTVPASGGNFALFKSLLSVAQLAAITPGSVVDGYIQAPSTDAVQIRDAIDAASIAARPSDFQEIPIGQSFPMPITDWISTTGARMKTNSAVSVTLVLYIL